MKIKTILCALMLFLPYLLISEPGCMDNSWHLDKKNDTKEYHYVQCNCDCKHQKILPDRGKCLMCGHYRYPRPFIIIKKNDLAQVSNSQIEKNITK